MLFTSVKEGLLPLLEYLERFAHHHHRVIVFDKITGRAAALLCIKADCQEIYSTLGSQLAIEALEKYGIKYHFTKIVPNIKKPHQEAICPMEKLSMDKKPEEFYQAVKDIIGLKLAPPELSVLAGNL